MFGEAESESPRVPSPWDSLISQSPSSNSCRSRSAASPSPLATELIPKLVPEADDGNVEYKLQLLNPSPSRFARLVTQLKWRLLEGGGQAYYEIGVADSGYLVGLPRAELEQSLETLEMMAGEIGASVIVVKEIEVPAAMAELAAAQSDAWSRKRPGRTDGDIGETASGGDSTTTSNTETEAETSTTDFDTEDDPEDLEKTVVYDKDVPPPFLSSVSKNDSGGSDSSSGPGTSQTQIFVMDPDDPAEVADAEGEIEVTTHGAQHSQFTIDLEISSVYKPRPVRTRVGHHAAILLHGKHHKRNKGKKYKNYPPPAVGTGWVAGTIHAEDQLSTSSLISVELKHGGDHLHEDRSANAPVDANPHEKVHHRRWARERKREAKRNALLHNAVATIASGGTDEGEHPERPWDSSQTINNGHAVRTTKDIKRSQHGLRNGHTATSDATEQLAAGLDGLHVSVAEPPQNYSIAADADGITASDAGASATEGDWVNVGSKMEQQDDSDGVLLAYEDDDDVFPSPTIPAPIFSPFRSDKVTATGTGDLPVSYLSAASEAVANHRERTRSTEEGGKADAAAEGDVKLEDENGKDKGETRLIVEALVVRKMSLEEAFLDFGGFSLI